MSHQRDEENFDRNLRRLLEDADLPRLDPRRRARMLDALKARQAELGPAQEHAMSAPVRRWTAWLAVAAAAAAVALGLWAVLSPRPSPEPAAQGPGEPPVPPTIVASPVLRQVLADGTVLIARRGAAFAVEGRRRLRLDAGDAYLIVARSDEPFVVRTPQGTATARGTRFALSLGEATRVAVAQGAVTVANEEGSVEVRAGQEGVMPSDQKPRREPAPRISYLVNWAREALAQARRLVDKAEPGTSKLVAKDPRGQEVRLSLRKYHVDVHIEDGLARTTVDQTFFNHVPWRIEGTFYFPLPPDASVSRLAMYVAGQRNEGGMVERGRGQQIYTHIKYQRRDPALLEMQEGNVFKMRIFPIEGRQEKRIFLSYTQPLPQLYGTLRYWFPMEHTHETAREVSFRVRVKDGAGRYEPHSSTHVLEAATEDGDLVLRYAARDTRPDQDLLLHLVPTERAARNAFATLEKGGHRYLFARVRPELPGEVTPRARQWIVLNDLSASRSALEVRAQAYILRRLIEEADDGDALSLVNLTTRAEVQEPDFVPVRDPSARELVRAAEVDLPLGATDLAAGLRAAVRLIRDHQMANPHILYLGDGVATEGTTSTDELLALLPREATFVGVGVGKRAGARLLQAAADATGGLFALIHPQEDIDWRVFDLVAALNTPRLLGLTVGFETAAGRPAEVLAYPSARAVAHGETLSIAARTEGRLPAWLVLAGTLDGEPYQKRYALAEARPDAGFIPRLWARRHIDALLRNGPEHKDEIVRLAKHYYVMTPYTSLIVLENDAMYQEFGVERGRKDHWALYPAPETIEVVKEPLPRAEGPRPGEEAPPEAEADAVRELVESIQFSLDVPFYFWLPRADPLARFALYRLLDAEADLAPFVALAIHLAASEDEEAEAPPPGDQPQRPGPPVPEEEPPVRILLRRAEREGLAQVRSSFATGGESLAPFGGRRLYAAWTPMWFSSGSVASFAEHWKLRLPAKGRRPSLAGEPVALLGFMRAGDDVSFLFPDYAPLTSLSTLRSDERAGREFGLGPLSVEGQLPVLATRPVGDRYRFFQMRSAPVLSPGIGDDRARFEDGLAPLARRRFGEALGQRLDAIRHEVAAHNARFTRYWGFRGGLGRHRELDLKRALDSRWHERLGDRQLTEEYLLSDTEGARRVVAGLPVRLDYVEGELGLSLRVPLLVHSTSRAAQSVPGAAAALAADFLVCRRDELEAGERTEDDERELDAVRQALERIGQAYPVLEDTGAFWSHQGWSYRPQPWAFQPPRVQADPNHVGTYDLVRYCPGLRSTLFDALCLVARRFGSEPRGQVSEAAAAALAAARQAIQPVAVRLEEDRPPLLVGPGDRFASVHTTPMYLEERMVCDGDQVVHLYPELGLAARREASPLRRAALRRLVPHLVEPAAWLARTCDVERLGKEEEEAVWASLGTGADAPAEPGRFVLQLTPVAQGEEAPPARLLVAVASDGRVHARRLVVEGEPRLTLTYTYRGGRVAARWLDGEGEELAHGEYLAEPFRPAADTFAADLEPYVVFDIPLRRPAHYRAQIEEMEATVAFSPELVALYRHLALAHIQEYRWQRWWRGHQEARDAVRRALNLLQPARREGKVGDLVLLGSTGYPQEVAELREMTSVAEGHPLVDFFRHCRSNNREELAELRDRLSGGLMGHLAAYRAVVHSHDRPEELRAFVEAYRRSPLLFAAAYYVSNWQRNRKGRPSEAWRALLAHPRWRFAAIHMAARENLAEGASRRVAEAFDALHRELSEKGVELPVSDRVAAILKRVEDGEPWQRVVRRARAAAEKTEGAAPLLRFAEMALRNGEAELAERAIAQAESLAGGRERPTVVLAIAQAEWAGGRPKEAFGLYEQLLADLEGRGVPPSAGLLAAAARLAEQAGETGRAIELEERSLALEHRELPELINLQAYRTRYRWLWSQYHRRVLEAARAGDRQSLDAWLARARKTWRLWYSVDPESPWLLKHMASLLADAGRTAEAWLYLSTLIDRKPRDAETYYHLAQWCRGRKRLDQAQQWLARAYEWDTANPRWLLERAKVLREMGRQDDADRLFQRIIDGQWAPGLEGYKQRAQKEMER
ncbi:MAG: VIT domain-containing protein [Candidatus Brocadiia bacterium]